MGPGLVAATVEHHGDRGVDRDATVLDPHVERAPGCRHRSRHAASVESVGRWWLRRGDLDLEAVVQFLVASIGPSLASVRGRGRSAFGVDG
jgi:hypothetical protein